MFIVVAVRDAQPTNGNARSLALGADSVEMLRGGKAVLGNETSALISKWLAGVCRKTNLKHQVPNAAVPERSTSVLISGPRGQSHCPTL